MYLVSQVLKENLEPSTKLGGSCHVGYADCSGSRSLLPKTTLCRSLKLPEKSARTQ